jgi:hypothetical protein
MNPTVTTSENGQQAHLLQHTTEHAPLAVRQQTESRSSWSFWPWVTLALSAIPIMLLLMGYGLTWALQEKLGVPRAAVFGSTMDLLELGSLPVVMWLEKSSALMGTGFWVDTWAQNWPVSVVFCVLAFLVAMPLWSEPWAMRATHWGQRARRSLRVDRRCWFVAALLSLAASFPWVVGALTRLMVGLLVFPLLFVLAGAKQGQAYLNKYVIEPRACAPVALHGKVNHAVTEEDNAFCIALDDDRAVEIARGRLVVSTQKVFVLLRSDGTTQLYRGDKYTPRQVNSLVAHIEPGATAVMRRNTWRS